MNWTEEQDQYLRDHRGKLSSSQIGGELGVTRNAVIGRAHRLKLEHLKSATVWSDVFRAKRMAKPKTVKPAKHLRVVALPPPRIDDASIPFEQRRTFLELGPHDCHWPVGHVGEPGFFFCGGVKRDGSPYCSAHHHIAYNPIREPLNARPKFSFVVTTQVLETSAEAA